MFIHKYLYGNTDNGGKMRNNCLIEKLEMSPLDRDKLYAIINAFDALDIRHCNLNISGNKVVIFTTQNLDKVCNYMESLIPSLPNSTVEVSLLRDENIQSNFIVQKQNVMDEKILVVNSNNDHIQTLSITLDLAEMRNITEDTILEMRSAFPKMEIKLDIGKNENQKECSEESLRSMYQSHKVSSSISGIISHSLNPSFREQCMALLSCDQYPTLSMQEVIFNKLNSTEQ